MKKWLSFILALTMIMSLSVNVLAADSSSARNVVAEKEAVAINEEKLYVNDGSGNMVEVIVTETIFAPASKPKKASVNSLTPEYNLGETREYTIRISNSAIGIPSYVGATISLASKTAIANAVAEAVAAKLGANFIPGLNLVTWILATAAFVNDVICGNNGFLITIGLEYAETYWHRENISTYGWRPISLSLGVY